MATIVEFMDNESFSFGSKQYMKEVPPTKEAIFSFRGQPELVETEYGEKYSFPISLHRHPSYPLLEALVKEGKPEPIDMEWQSKCQSARQLYDAITKQDNLSDGLPNANKFYKKLMKHYNESKWYLVRFDNGAYFLEVQQ